MVDTNNSTVTIPGENRRQFLVIHILNRCPIPHLTHHGCFFLLLEIGVLHSSSSEQERYFHIETMLLAIIATDKRHYNPQ